MPEEDDPIVTLKIRKSRYQMLIQMLIQSNPLIQEIAQQVEPQLQPSQPNGPANGNRMDAAVPNAERR